MRVYGYRLFLCQCNILRVIYYILLFPLQAEFICERVSHDSDVHLSYSASRRAPSVPRWSHRQQRILPLTEDRNKYIL